MRKVELIYIEVINETEQLFAFETIFNNKPYVIPVVLNMALPVDTQDFVLVNAITELINMTRKDAAGAVAVTPCKCECKSCKCQG